MKTETVSLTRFRTKYFSSCYYCSTTRIVGNQAKPKRSKRLPEHLHHTAQPVHCHPERPRISDTGTMGSSLLTRSVFSVNSSGWCTNSLRARTVSGGCSCNRRLFVHHPELSRIYIPERVEKVLPVVTATRNDLRLNTLPPLLSRATRRRWNRL